METTHIYLTTEQAIEESKKQDGLIPSEFLTHFQIILVLIFVL